MRDLLIEPPEELEVLSEINDIEICSNAKYKFDHPLFLQPRDLILMHNGQFFLIRNREEMLIDGRWTVVSS
jgi:hypothetical protein